MAEEIITEARENLKVIFNAKLDIMTVAYLYKGERGNCSGDDDDYPIIWFITEKGRVNSAEILDWRDWGIHHIAEIANIIFQKTDWPEQPIVQMLTNVSKKGEHIKALWEE